MIGPVRLPLSVVFQLYGFLERDLLAGCLSFIFVKSAELNIRNSDSQSYAFPVCC